MEKINKQLLIIILILILLLSIAVFVRADDSPIESLRESFPIEVEIPEFPDDSELDFAMRAAIIYFDLYQLLHKYTFSISGVESDFALYISKAEKEKEDQEKIHQEALIKTQVQTAIVAGGIGAVLGATILLILKGL